MTLKIISAEDVLFEGEVTLVALPGVMGQFTVLQNHATLISVLTAGNIEYVADGQRGYDLQNRLRYGNRFSYHSVFLLLRV